jgi:hypothetical protein
MDSKQEYIKECMRYVLQLEGVYPRIVYANKRHRTRRFDGKEAEPYGNAKFRPDNGVE